MSAVSELNWVPSDAQSATLQSTGNRKIDDARLELHDTINFMQDDSNAHDPTLFFKIDGSDEFDKSKVDRYDSHGCKSRTFTYWHDQGTAKHKWWSDVLIAVQNDPADALKKSNGKFTLFVDFHGGGFTSGDILHGAWRQKHKVEFTAEHPVICVCPNYPLLPWFSGTDILAAMDQFWQYLFSDRFQTHLNELHPGLRVRLTNIAVSGDSAGGWLAMYSYFTKFALTPGGAKQHLPIRVLYLQYPMLRHYKRSKPADGYAYLDIPLTDESHAQAGAALRSAWEKWRAVLADENTTPYNIDILRPWAPLGMSASYLGSTYEDLWRDFFQAGDDDMLDIIERLERMSPGDAPAGETFFYMYHGVEDKNCNVEESRDAVRLLKEKFGVDPERVHLVEVEGQEHGFDHQMSVRDEKFLEDVYEKIAARLFP